MNVHDGIPFVLIEFADKRCLYINPVDIVAVCDLSEREAKEENTKFPAIKISFSNGKQQTVGNISSKELVERINKTMLSWKDKLAEKELLK